MNFCLVILGVTSLGFVSTKKEPLIIELLDNRILGGEDANICDNPHQASVQYWGGHYCGGVIIGPKWVLTVANCIVGFEVLYISVKVGTSNKDAGGQIIRVKNAYSHPKYNSSTFDYDVGLLELHSEIKVPCASPVSLPNPNTQLVEGSTGVVTGWGRKTGGGPVVNHLQVLQIPILSPKACRDAYGESTFTERMVCAGLLKGRKDVCSGDSGGPLMVDKMLIGLVSWGYGCARPTYPSVYTNVAAFRTYITEITGI